MDRVKRLIHMNKVFGPLLLWFFRTVVIKFLVLGAVCVAVSFLVPYVVKFLGDFVDPSGIGAVFSMVDSGVWWFADAFALDFGIPLLISAHVARFLIRRLPVIG